MRNTSALLAAAILVGCGSAADSAAERALPTTVPTGASVDTSTTTVPTTTPPAPIPDLLPATPLDMADALIEAEMRIRDAEVQVDRRAEWGRRQQRLYRHLAVHEEWADDVVTDVAVGAPTSVALAIERNWAARKELSGLTTSGPLSTVLPAWRIREPLPPEELLGYYRSAEAETGIEWVYLAAINLVETRMGRIEGLSTAGATGPMQFLPSTWEECCEGDPTVDRDAIHGAAQYLVDRGGPADMGRALKGYNNSDYYVRAVTAYADVLRDDPQAYYGYHAWEVFFRSAPALVRLPVGYNEPEPVDAAQWIADNPEHVLG